MVLVRVAGDAAVMAGAQQRVDGNRGVIWQVEPGKAMGTQTASLRQQLGLEEGASGMPPGYAVRQCGGEGQGPGAEIDLAKSPEANGITGFGKWVYVSAPATAAAPAAPPPAAPAPEPAPAEPGPQPVAPPPPQQPPPEQQQVVNPYPAAPATYQLQPDQYGQPTYVQPPQQISPPPAQQWHAAPPPQPQGRRGNLNFTPEQLQRLNVLAQKLGPLNDAQVRYILNRAAAKQHGGGSKCSHCGRTADGRRRGRRNAHSQGGSTPYSDDYSDSYYSYDDEYYSDYYSDYEYPYDDESVDDARAPPRHHHVHVHGAAGAEGGAAAAAGGRRDGRRDSLSSVGPAAPPAQQYATGRRRPRGGASSAGSFRWHSFVAEWGKQTKRIGSDPLVRGVCHSTLARIARRQDENLRRFDALPELMEMRTNPSGGAAGRSARHTGSRSSGSAAERAAARAASPPAHSYYTGYGLPPEQRPWVPAESSSGYASQFPRQPAAQAPTAPGGAHVDPRLW